MSRSEIEYLRHIRDEARYLEETSQEVSWEEFAEDETLKRAFVRSIGVIGEATKNLSTEIRKRHSDVEWRAMAGMRDQLIHGYFGVDYEIVWEVTTEKAPELKEAIKQNSDSFIATASCVILGYRHDRELILRQTGCSVETCERVRIATASPA